MAMFDNTRLIASIRAKVRAVQADESVFGTLSVGEQLAVAMVLNRFDLLGNVSMLAAVDRLGQDWVESALYVQRNGWQWDSRT